MQEATVDEAEGSDNKCEALRKLRLLLEDFPHNHNPILIGQPALNTALQLRHNHDLKSRVIYSARLEAITASDLAEFIHSQLDRVGLPHATFTVEAINLITGSSKGALLAVRNLCIDAITEAVFDQTKIVDLKQVNAVHLQSHWRYNTIGEPNAGPAGGASCEGITHSCLDATVSPSVCLVGF